MYTKTRRYIFFYTYKGRIHLIHDLFLCWADSHILCTCVGRLTAVIDSNRSCFFYFYWSSFWVFILVFVHRLTWTGTVRKCKIDIRSTKKHRLFCLSDFVRMTRHFNCVEKSYSDGNESKKYIQLRPLSNSFILRRQQNTDSKSHMGCGYCRSHGITWRILYLVSFTTRSNHSTLLAMCWQCLSHTNHIIHTHAHIIWYEYAWTCTEYTTINSITICTFCWDASQVFLSLYLSCFLIKVVGCVHAYFKCLSLSLSLALLNLCLK